MPSWMSLIKLAVMALVGLYIREYRKPVDHKTALKNLREAFSFRSK